MKPITAMVFSKSLASSSSSTLRTLAACCARGCEKERHTSLQSDKKLTSLFSFFGSVMFIARIKKAPFAERIGLLDLGLMVQVRTIEIIYA